NSSAARPGGRCCRELIYVVTAPASTSGKRGKNHLSGIFPAILRSGQVREDSGKGICPLRVCDATTSASSALTTSSENIYDKNPGYTHSAMRESLGADPKVFRCAD